MTVVGKSAKQVTLERACSRLSESLGEPLSGTASTVRHWLLVEQPGAWGFDALLESDLPRPVATVLKERAAGLGLRVVLIRRPHRVEEHAARTVYLVHSGPREVWHRRLSVNSPADLVDLDLARLMHDSVGASRQPLYLVCTNSKRDVCCAVAGVPLARRLAGLGDVWECSHIGGDRFAGNLVCLPHGLYYGRVTPDIGVRIVDRHARGELLLSHLRGRASYEFAVQAADIFIRRSRALHRIDDLTLDSVTAGVPVHCAFRTRTGELLEVEVDVGPVSAARRLTCHGDETRPPAYRARWLRA
ncbi:MAG: sucrase ferredoxin [Mycobacteriales bacterium]